MGIAIRDGKQSRLAQDDFSGGMVRNVAPHLIQENAVYDVINGLLNDDGSVYRRGGTAYKSDAATDTEIVFLWDGSLTPGARTFWASESNFFVLDSDDESPVNLGGDGLTQAGVAAEVGGFLFLPGGYIYGGSRKTAAYSTGTVTTVNDSPTVTGSGTSWTANVDVGMIFQTATSERVYIVQSVDSDTQITLTENYEGTGAGGKTYSLSNVYKIAAADPYYDSAGYVSLQSQKLFAYSDNRVFFSNLGNPHAYDATDYHRLPAGATVTGAANIGDAVLIFSTKGVWKLSGAIYDLTDAAGNVQHQLDLLSEQLILWDPAGLANWEQMVIAPCVNGVYLIDGVSSPVMLSSTIDPALNFYTDGGYGLGQTVAYENHFFMPVLEESTNIVQETFVCRLDTAYLDRRRTTKFPWTRFSGTGGTMNAFAVRVSGTTNTPFLWGAGADARIHDCTTFFHPANAVKNDADGTTFSFRLITRDYETGDMTENVVRKMRLRYELIDNGGDDPTITAGWASEGYRDLVLGEWDHPAGLWDTGFGPSGTEPWASAALGLGDFTEFADTAPEDNGQNPYVWQVNKRLRYVRFVVKTDDPCTSLTIRSLESFIRPARTVRR